MIDYDYENLFTNTLNIKDTSYIYRKDNEVINSVDKINDKNHELLLKIRLSFGKTKYLEIIRNKYEYDDTDNIANSNPCFFLLKPSKIDPKMNRYKLNPGEIVKIGRITMRIRDIKFKAKNLNKSLDNSLIINSNIINTNSNNLGIKKEKEKDNKKITRLETTESKFNKNDMNEKTKNKNSKKKTQKDIFSKLEKKKRVCRICYLEEEENDLENPLVQPCTCTGSMKFIHLTCLRKWISTRSCVKIDNSEDCSIFLIKPVECELCKTKFPDFIKYENRLFPVIDFSQEFNNYLTLESLTLDKQNNKFIYVISLDKDRKIKIGRGHEAKVILSDISVSRVHCFMIVERNHVFIEDNDSKFGTLILVQTPNIKLSENLPLFIQVGRTFFNCKLEKPFKLFSCCEADDKNNIFYYFNQNEKFIKDNLGMVIKPDLSEIDSANSNNLINNNTFEEKVPPDIINKYKNNITDEKIIFNVDDKMSDNEYRLLKHNKEKKMLKKEMIYNEVEEEKKQENENEENENEVNEDNNDNDDYDDENNEDNVTASLVDEDERKSERTEDNGKNSNHKNSSNNNINEEEVNHN